MKELPRIAVTMGDPSGIGPEIIIKALSSDTVRSICRPVIVGDRRLFPATLRKAASFIDIPVAGFPRLKPGHISAATGRAAYRCVIKAVELIRAGGAVSLVTAPISKEALLLAGVKFPGHTELLAGLTGSRDFAMLMAAGRLRVVMVTRHLPVSAVGAALTSEEICRTAFLCRRDLESRFGIKRPRIAVCALNPHAGENGLLGTEELRVIGPAVMKIAAGGIDVSGPLPADSAWLKLKKGRFDLMIAQYHDQAMIGLKCLAPEKIVNITLGLPFVRTSPGHGTANDIAGKGIADPRSMIEAVRTAVRLGRRAAV